MQVEGGTADAAHDHGHARCTTRMLAPTLFSDVDGRYVGLDREVHSVPAGERGVQHLFDCGTRIARSTRC